MNNPLLNFDQLPHFNAIDASHVLPALQEILTENRAVIAQLEGLNSPSWANFALRMEDLEDRLGRVWSPASHLNAVQDSEQMRAAYQTGIALLTDYHSEVGQNQALYQQYKTLKASAEFADLTPAQQKVIDNSLLDFRLSGAELDQAQQAELRELNRQLSELSNQFERNVLDATQAWELRFDNTEQLAGLPPSALSMAKQFAADAGFDGYLLNLQIPCYLAVIQYADDGELREKIYKAYSTRASTLSEAPQFDNTSLIEQILAARVQKAQLLGFTNYAELSLQKKMATSPAAVIDFLHDIVHYAKPVATKELQELEQFAQQKFGQKTLAAWDIPYYSEKLRESRYAFNDEQVKPYFPAQQVFDGLFEILQRLFGIRLEQQSDISTWHPQVQVFNVFNDQYEVIGKLYADLYVRKNKRGGAWMDSCIDRRVVDGEVQLPVAYLVCNFSPPIGDAPALLSHDEVETLFHEFGHTIHHLLTQVDELSVAGINGVAWDAVELPSQFLENWCWHPDSLKLLAKHYQTGDALPPELISKMRAAKNFQSGMQTIRQVEFALFDMRIHNTSDALDVQAEIDQVREQVSVVATPAYNRFQNSFGHIFAGGYAAGYYSYKWAEVLSADAFSRFEEEGIFNANTGRDFLQAVLHNGGVYDANDLFERFRGRAPKIAALLQQTGIL